MLPPFFSNLMSESASQNARIEPRKLLGTPNDLGAFPLSSLPSNPSLSTSFQRLTVW